jgi:hypothetical protein
MTTPFFNHSILGVGAPVRGISILIGSPARTLILRPIIPSSHSFGFSENRSKYIYGGSQKKHSFTFHRFSDKDVRSVTLFARSSSINSCHSVLILVSFLHSVVVIFQMAHRFLVEFHPTSSRAISSFNVISNNRRAAVTNWCRPFDLDVIFVAIHKFWFSRFSRYI